MYRHFYKNEDMENLFKSAATKTPWKPEEKKEEKKEEKIEKGIAGSIVGGAIGATVGHPFIGGAVGSLAQDKFMKPKEGTEKAEEEDDEETMKSAQDVQDDIVRANIARTVIKSKTAKAFVSQAQRAYFHANEDEIGKKVVDEFEKKTPKGKKLPYKVSKKD